MIEIIVPVLLAAIKWGFGALSDNKEKQKRVAKLVTKWMGVMSKEFLSSVEISEEYAKMWKEMEAEPWAETK